MFYRSAKGRGRTLVMGVAVISVLSLSACDESITLAPGAIDTADSCSRFQQSIVTAREKENQLRVENAVAGALVGAVLGAAIAGPNNRRQGALLGAVLGGATAGIATAENQKSQRAADANVLRDVNGKAGTARTLLTQAGKSAASLRNCRLGQIAGLERSVRSGKISNAAARSQLQQLKRRASADNQIISASFNGIGNKVDQFVNTGARASGVESAILTRQKSAQTAKARQVRAATPNVARARSAQAQVQAQDLQQKQRVDRGLNAIDVLLG